MSIVRTMMIYVVITCFLVNPTYASLDDLVSLEETAIGSDDSERITLELKGVDILDVLKVLSKKSGLNIEALCASADGKKIYIGFRNPRLYSKAIVVPLNNARRVIEQEAPPIFADPLLWDLKGYGIRSMEYSHFHKAFFIVAGAHDEKPAFALYRWSGDKDSQPVRVQGQTQMPFCAIGESTEKDISNVPGNRRRYPCVSCARGIYRCRGSCSDR